MIPIIIAFETHRVRPTLRVKANGAREMIMQAPASEVSFIAVEVDDGSAGHYANGADDFSLTRSTKTFRCESEKREIAI